MQCPRCTNTIPSDSEFCHYCGLEIQSHSKRSKNAGVPHETNDKGHTQLASKSRRFANYVIDGCFTLFIYIFLIIFVAFYESFKASSSDIDLTQQSVTLLSLPVNFLYYVACEFYWGQTVGKMVTGTKVIKVDGSKPDFMDIVVRTMLRLIPFEPFSFLGSSPQGWHDTVSKTKVVKT